MNMMNEDVEALKIVNELMFDNGVLRRNILAHMQC